MSLQNLSIDEKAVRGVADSLVRDLLLGDVDFTSIAFIAFECIKDYQEVRLNCVILTIRQCLDLGSMDDLSFLPSRRLKHNSGVQLRQGWSLLNS